MYTYKLGQLSVIGLMVEAKVTLTQDYEKFRNQFGIDFKLTKNIVVSTIKYSNKLIKNHFYNRN